MGCVSVGHRVLEPGGGYGDSIVLVLNATELNTDRVPTVHGLSRHQEVLGKALTLCTHSRPGSVTVASCKPDHSLTSLSFP